MMKVRLNKYLSECGVTSRRKADSLINDGRISINGNIVLELGSKIDTETDEVFIDGELLKERKKVYYLLNKPKGVITSTTDDRNRITVIDLIKTKEKIFPIGRLDYNTTGVLLLTNDGDFSNFLTHPKNGVEREYEVVIDKPLAQDDKLKLLKGVFLDKRKSVFTSITYPKRNNFSVARVVTVEGRNHFVKRMFEALGYRVNDLSRIRFGKITTRNLQKGEYRIISQKEINQLKK